jgi:hypothetical protein
VGFVAENMSLMVSVMRTVTTQSKILISTTFPLTRLFPLQSKVNTRLFELSMPQPIDECLKYLGDLLCADRKLVRPVVSVLAKKLASKTVRPVARATRHLHNMCWTAVDLEGN